MRLENTIEFAHMALFPVPEFLNPVYMIMPVRKNCQLVDLHA